MENVSKLLLEKHIPKRNITLNDKDDLLVLSLCALSDDVVLLACGSGGLRAVSLSSAPLFAHGFPAFRDVNVNGVAFDTHTGTLLLLEERTYPYPQWEVVSLCRTSNGGLKCSDSGPVYRN